jgi:hypothetical protein
MHVAAQLAELAMAGIGAISVIAFGLRRARTRRGASAPQKGPRWLPCPIDWCVGHTDKTRYAPSYARGHAQPCWNGKPDDLRLERL